MLDINALKVGIYNKLNTTDDEPSAVANLVTGIFHKIAPQGTSFPYILYWIVTGSNKDTFTSWRDSVLAQIDIYCQNKDKSGVPVSGGHHCGVISEAVTSLMDEAVLGEGIYFCQRQGPPRDLYEEDTGTFHQVLEYRIELQKSKS